ncbi:MULTISPECIES: hypothetical protein [Geobacillus]|uniref:Uncharacterized protein n=1 Tax=Geobacillus thermodenitrificans (strain NG80-2) TaxID=420246 RepID=A4IQG1_GEOTN|nr:MULTISPECIES: hypothetical protein [Geobacillus]ABO67565.1 hypothetical protein GTNG_2216 [Geobacillus thermodenitrificans NG80-2]OQP09656.1 hypothetical protein B1691_09640 [Geobacillus sp. 47C-IIb]PTR47548.1 hypothetical protein CW755_07795 [Geobacillus thermodenitrificans]QNU31834.1 hypothetical protein IC804_03375 [Geobacillus sp. 47C-IIb]
MNATFLAAIAGSLLKRSLKCAKWKPPRVHPIRRDLLWLLGAADPAEAIHNRLDHSEKQLKSQNRTFTKKTGSHI